MHVRSFFTTLLNVLFPAKGASRFDSAFTTEVASLHFEPFVVSDCISSLFTYRDPVIRKSVWQLKYYKNTKVISAFAATFHSFLLEEMADLACFSNFEKPLLVPMPMSAGRLAERGYNQCEILLEHVRSLDPGLFEIRSDVVVKIKDTPRQTKLNRRERLLNIQGCFSILLPELISGRNIILIDDVVTTGSTLSEVGQILLNAGAKNVLAMTLAH